LRTLAKRQAELAALPVMDVRKKLWTDMNDGKSGARPPVVIEADSFDRDFLPESMLRCKTAYGRKLEKQFLHPIRYHEVLNDDHVCPGIVQMDWHIAYDEFGIKMETTYARDCNGEKLGFHVEHPIKDLDDGFDRIQPAAFSVDRDGTAAEKAFLEDALKGTGIVYSRKPTPNLLGVDEVLDEVAWSQHIRETLEFTVPAGVPTEFVVRDVYTVHGNLNKPARAVELARREINRFFG
jgi:hypothetical protein